MSNFSGQELTRLLDRALFTAQASRGEIERLCSEARQHSFYGVAVNSSHVELAAALLEDSDVNVIALIGFPLGSCDPDVKRFELETALDQGAQEFDFVLNHGRLKDGDHRYVLREMRDLAEAADERLVKVILESSLLSREEIRTACELALDSGLQFISTATDFHSPAITVDDVKYLRECVGENFGVKAVGRISDLTLAQALLDAGADRLGIGMSLRGRD